MLIRIIQLHPILLEVVLVIALYLLDPTHPPFFFFLAFWNSYHITVHQLFNVCFP